MSDEIREENKELVRRTLQLTQEGLERQLVQAVHNQQHNLGTHEDVDAAFQKLTEFKESRWQKQSRIEQLVDESFAEK